MSPSTHCHFGDETFQSITCTCTNNLYRTTKRQNTKTLNNASQSKWPYTLKKPRIREMEPSLVAFLDIRPGNGRWTFCFLFIARSKRSTKEMKGPKSLSSTEHSFPKTSAVLILGTFVPTELSLLETVIPEEGK